MFSEINVQKDQDDFEDRIMQIYNKYEHADIDKEYTELWNGFVDLIRYIQNQDSLSNMSPMQLIQLMKDIGFTNYEIKELFLAQMKEN